MKKQRLRPLSLHPLNFEEALSDLLKVKPDSPPKHRQKPKKTSRLKRRTRPK